MLDESRTILLAIAGGVVENSFKPRQRGLGISVFSTAPLLGPVLGTVFGGLIAQYAGFQWLEGFFVGQIPLIIHRTLGRLAGSS